MPDARIGDLDMRYDVHGTDAGRLPALLVMGFGLPGHVWRFVVPELAGERRVVTFDNRGAGHSAVTPGPYRMAQLADDVRRLLDHLAIPRAHLVGVSMGGMVSQEVALNHRDRLASLTLIATHPGGLANRMPRAAGLWHFLSANMTKKKSDRLHAVARLLFPKAYRAEVGEDYLHDVLAHDFAVAPSRAGRRAQLSAVWHHDTRQRLHRLADLPTLVVKPERDLLVQPRCSEVLHRAIPGSRIVRYADAGHGLIRQKSKDLGAELRAHFAAAEAGALVARAS